MYLKHAQKHQKTFPTKTKLQNLGLVGFYNIRGGNRMDLFL